MILAIPKILEVGSLAIPISNVWMYKYLGINCLSKKCFYLQDPAQRLISDYTHEKILFKWRYPTEEYPSFKDVVFHPNGTINISYEPIQVGIYVKHLQRWLKYFPWKQIHIIDGGSFIKNPVVELKVRLGPVYDSSEICNMSPHNGS